MALLLYFTILPRDLPDPSGQLSSLADICHNVETKTKLVRKGGHTSLKLDNGMRANLHVCIHGSVVQLQHLMTGEIEKSCTLHPLLSRLKLAWQN